MVHRIKDSERFYASVAIHGRRTLRVAGFAQKKLTQNRAIKVPSYMDEPLRPERTGRARTLKSFT